MIAKDAAKSMLWAFTHSSALGRRVIASLSLAGQKRAFCLSRFSSATISKRYLLQHGEGSFRAGHQHLSNVAADSAPNKWSAELEVYDTAAI